MKRFIAILMTLCLVLGMSSVSVWAATIGQQLPEKEDGWERYDDNNPYIQYKDFPYLNLKPTIEGACGYGGTASLNTTNSTTGEVKFKFIGTKIRLICNTGIKYRTSEAHVYIDDKPYTFSCSQVDGTNTLVFESEELNNSMHDVIIKEFKITGNTTHSTFGITAIDIKGELVAYDNINLTASANATTSAITLNWNVVDNARSYNVKRSTTSAGIYTTIATTAAITYTDNNVTNGAIYYYVVSAINAKGESANSNEVSVTLNGGTPSAKLSVLLNEGENVQLSTAFNLDNNKNFTWSSTNEKVATVDSNGKVTAVAVGNADIYAQSTDGTFKEYIPVKVLELADELRLSVHLKAGEKAKLYLADDASKVTWSSMDSSIATVAADGQVTGVKKGLAIVKAELDGQAYQIYVRVNG